MATFSTFMMLFAIASMNLNKLFFGHTINFCYSLSDFNKVVMGILNIAVKETPATLRFGELVHGAIGYQYMLSVIEDPDVKLLVEDNAVNCIPISLWCDNPFDFIANNAVFKNGGIISDSFTYDDSVLMPNSQSRLSVCVCPTHYLTSEPNAIKLILKDTISKDILSSLFDINYNRSRYLPTPKDTPSDVEICLLGSGVSINFKKDGESTLNRCIIDIDNGDKILGWTWVRYFY